MAYREIDDLARRDAIEDALSRLAPSDRRWRALRDELERLDIARRQAARMRLPLVARARAASPCGERVDTMLGDGAIRRCARCDDEVLDPARMTIDEADRLVRERVRTSAPLRARHDGTLRFGDCEVGARAIRTRRIRVRAASVALAAATLATVMNETDTRYFGPLPSHAEPEVRVPPLASPVADETVIDRLLDDERRQTSLVLGCPEGFVRAYTIGPPIGGEGCDTPDLPCNRCVPDPRARHRSHGSRASR